MLNKQSDILKIVTEQILNYAHYHITVDSLDVKVPDITDDPFFKNRYQLSTQEMENGDIVVVKAKKVNITEAVKYKNNIDFDVHFVYLLVDSTVTEVNVEIYDFDFIEADDITVYIKDFINLYMRYAFGGLINVFNSYKLISHQNTEDVKIEFGESILLNFVLKKSNNVNLSIKSLFMNDLDVTYDINISDSLYDQIDDFSEKLVAKVKDLAASNNTLVTGLHSFDTEYFAVNVNTLKQRYSSLVEGESVGNDDIVKELIFNSMVRSGESTVSNILALYDNSDYVSVNSVIYSIEVGGEQLEGVPIDDEEDVTDDEEEPVDNPEEEVVDDTTAADDSAPEEEE